jgi:hypothetical protein
MITPFFMTGENGGTKAVTEKKVYNVLLCFIFTLYGAGHKIINK